LCDICESTEKVYGDLLPRLRSQAMSGTEVENLLHEIGEEFRHILYHIRDPEFFSYLE
jgi:hypothetical protein